MAAERDVVELTGVAFERRVEQERLFRLSLNSPNAAQVDEVLAIRLGLQRRAEEAARAYVSGDVDLYLELVHHARGFTLLPPFGGPFSAHEDRRAEVRSWDGTGITGGDAQLGQGVRGL